VRLFRPADLRIDDDGELEGIVRRRVPTEEGTRLDLDVTGGSLVVVAPPPGPEVGATVRLTAVGGVEVARDQYSAPDHETEGIDEAEHP
jgi:hypothetical protein